MAMRNTFDMLGSQTQEVDKMLGTAYVNVKAVADNLQAVLYVAANLQNLVPKQVEFQESADKLFFQWRYVGDTDWKNLLAMSDIPQAQFQVSGDWLQWKYKNESVWANLWNVQDFFDQVSVSPTANKIPRAGADNKLATGWLNLTEVNAAVVQLVEDVVTSLAGSNGASLVAYQRPEVSGVLRTLMQEIIDRAAPVTQFGAKGDGVALEQFAIKATIDAVAAKGGGVVYFPPGTYLVGNVNPGSTSWDTNCCIWVLHDNIHLVFAPGAKLKMAANANSHVVCFGQRTNGTVLVNNCSITGVEIDGNRANQNAPIDANLWHNSGIMVQSGCTNIHTRNFNIHDCMWYGIGYQRDGLINCSIQQGVISRVGVDAIDWKNDSDSAYGNVIDQVSADNWGLLDVAVSGDPSAAFDLRSGITASNLVAQTPGQSAVAGIRLQNGTPGASPVQATKVSKYVVTGARVSGSVGVRVITRNAVVTDGYASEWDDGHSFSEPDCRFNNLHGYHNVTSGFRLWNNVTAGTKAGTNTLSGLVARGNNAGVICDGSVNEANFDCCDVRSNTTYGYDIRAGCADIRVIGGSCTGNGANSAAGFADLGTNTIIRNVSGYRTSTVVSGQVALDGTTGTRSFSIAHGLPFTPQYTDVVFTLRRNTNVGDYVVGFGPVVTGCDAANVNGQIRITTASATAGAVVDVMAKIESKNR